MNDTPIAATTPAAPADLAAEYIAPPFTVLDARQGYWTERKRRWNAWGITGDAGRDDITGDHADAQAFNWHMGGSNGNDWRRADDSAPSTSMFDPVLCELVYQWFTPRNGVILDPFAGEATKGLVAARLGRRYIGVELRAEQIAANEHQARTLGVFPRWIHGDAAAIDTVVDAHIRADLVFTSPPYYDLEIYSKDKADGSTFATYDGFMAWYRGIFAACVARMRDDRFLVIKVGDVRDNRGNYRGFVTDNVAMFRDLGLHLYNEAILITAVGTLAMRARRQFDVSRKLGKGHQQILVFVKGDGRRATAALAAVDVEAVPDTQMALFDA